MIAFFTSLLRYDKAGIIRVADSFLSKLLVNGNAALLRYLLQKKNIWKTGVSCQFGHDLSNIYYIDLRTKYVTAKIAVVCKYGAKKWD